MKRTVALLACGATLAAGGIFAGSVIGGDGSIDTADRIGGDYSDPIVQQLDATGTKRVAGTAGKAKKPKVIYGTGEVTSVDPEGNSTISLICPKKYPVPLSAGLDTSIAGIFPGRITRSDSAPRAMLVAVVNTTKEAGEWTPTAVCAKGMKEG
jgi:hypothetical protein